MADAPYLTPARRPAGVTFAAVILGLLSVFGLLSIALTFAGTFLMHNPALRQAPGGLAIAAVGDLILACLLAFGLWTAIGLFRMRSWARYSMIVIGVLTCLGWGGMSLLTFTVSHFIPAATKATVSPQVTKLLSAVFMGIVLVEFAIAILGLWWAIYFNFKRVRLAFAAASDAFPLTAASSIEGPLATIGAAPGAGQKSFWQTVTVVVAWLMLFGGVMILPFAWLRPPFFFLGIALHGNGSLAGWLVVAAVQLFAGASLLRRLPGAYWTAIAWQVVGVLNGASFLVPSIAARATEMGAEFSRLWMPQSPNPFMNSIQFANFQRHSVMASGVFCIFIFLFFLYALVRCRSWYLGDSRTVADGFAD